MPSRPAPLLVALALAFVGCVISAPALAQDRPRSAAAAAPAKAEPAPERVWSILRAEDGYVLRYGIARTADPAFAVTCRPEAQLLQIAVEVKTKSVRSGDGAALSLVNGRHRLELAAATFAGSATGRIVAEAAVTLEPRIFDLFRDGERLTMRLPGVSETYPLEGARAKLPDFERVCLAKR